MEGRKGGKEEWKEGEREGGRKKEGRWEGGMVSSKYSLPQMKEPTKPPWLCNKPSNYPLWLRTILGVTIPSPRAGTDMAVSVQHEAALGLEPRLSFLQRLYCSTVGANTQGNSCIVLFLT